MISTRKYTKSDAKDLVSIFYNTIHKVNIKDYSEEQVNAWAPESSLNLERWMIKWEKLVPLVAIIDDKIVGFTEFDEKTGYIDCFYCHHDFIGKGVGTVLMKAIDDIAKNNNLNRIYADVSVTAKPFFQSKGFNHIKEQLVDTDGVKLKNHVMEKLFSQNG